jgi:glycosyltransferase involved in cell wall biosynthesis
MANPVVSIIIPCYRQAHFLAQTIESALAQVFSPIEVIVINDGSDDDTEMVARRFVGRILYHWQPNAGLPAARNKAIALASGKYVLCLDSDDLLHPEAIQWLVEAADGKEDALCVMGYTRFKNDPRKDAYGDCLPPAEGSAALKLLVSNLGPPNTFLCPRSMINSIGGFDVRLKACEDWDAWLRALFAGARIVPVPRIGAYYRQHPTSMSKNRALMATTKSQTLWRNYCWTCTHADRVLSRGGDVKKIRGEIAAELFVCGYCLRDIGRYLPALRLYGRSIRAGGVSTPALSGIMKLLPHWALHRLYAVAGVSATI